MIEGMRIKDPFIMQGRWISEDNRVRYWPVTLYPDIYRVLAFYPNELSSDDLSNYKSSKAYSYHANG